MFDGLPTYPTPRPLWSVCIQWTPLWGVGMLMLWLSSLLIIPRLWQRWGLGSEADLPKASLGYSFQGSGRFWIHTTYEKDGEAA